MMAVWPAVPNYMPSMQQTPPMGSSITVIPEGKVRFEVFEVYPTKKDHWHRVGFVDVDPDNAELFITDYLIRQKKAGNFMAVPKAQSYIFKVYVKTEYETERLK